MFQREQQPGVKKAVRLFTEVQRVLSHVEANGIKIDVPYLDQAIADAQQQIAEVERKIKETEIWDRWFRIFGAGANLLSRDQCGTVLFKNVRNAHRLNMGFDCTHWTKGGNPETSEDVVERIEGLEEFGRDYARLQRLNKVLGTYLRGIKRGMDSNALIHPNFSLFTVISYRTSCIAKGMLILVSRDKDKAPVEIPVEEVRVGDYVYCIDDEFNVRLKKVLNAWKTGHREVVRLHHTDANGQKRVLDCTPEHKIRMADGEYVEAYLTAAYKRRQFTPNSLRNSCALSVDSGKWRMIAGCRRIELVEFLPDTVDVYDLEVEGCHNFIANGICVHNCSQPNFQNMPTRNPEMAKIIRQCFIPRAPDRHFVEIDFSGVEVRTTAAINRDPTLIASINEGLDFHKSVAAMAYILPESEITKQLRTSVKGPYTFAAFYGSYWKSIAYELWDQIVWGMGGRPLTLKDGTLLLEHLAQKGIARLGNAADPQPGTYFHHIKKTEQWFWGEKFKVYADWKESNFKKYKRNGYVDLPSGFRCAGILDKNAISNFGAQGAASHCLLWSMAKLHDDLNKRKMSSLIIGQIHDSIVIDVAGNELEDVLQTTYGIMTRRLPNAWKWLVPLDAEVEVAPAGLSWWHKEPRSWEK